MAQRMKIHIAYDGRPFHGWQRQPRHRTVQGELENALGALFQGHRVAIVGAGRTDAGVHAAGQAAHIDAPGAIPPDALIRGLNARLPREIRILGATTVDPSFHARKSARDKRYVYRARWHGPTAPWSSPRSADIRPIIDDSALRSAIAGFVGRHDWASFTVPDPGPESTIRTLFSVRYRALRGGFDIEFVGEGFLRYQVRRMVGALLEIGAGERSPKNLEDLIVQPQPGAQIRTAHANGLCLEHVYYRACAAVAATPPETP